MLGNIPDIGAIHEIEIGHDGKGFASSWHLEEVVVNATSSDPPANKRFSFVADRWLDKVCAARYCHPRYSVVLKALFPAY